jgi:hypothetical protein
MCNGRWDFEVVVNAASMVARPCSHSRCIQPLCKKKKKKKKDLVQIGLRLRTVFL